MKRLIVLTLIVVLGFPALAEAGPLKRLRERRAERKIVAVAAAPKSAFATPTVTRIPQVFGACVGGKCVVR